LAVQALSTLEWIGRGENLAWPPPSGSGKFQFVEALTQTAIDNNLRVHPRWEADLMRPDKFPTAARVLPRAPCCSSTNVRPVPPGSVTHHPQDRRGALMSEAVVER
jgi:hypothetical protein